MVKVIPDIGRCGLDVAARSPSSSIFPSGNITLGFDRFGLIVTDREYFGGFGVNSLPLREEEFKQKECKGFFGGILPEERNRKVIARILQISDTNDFAMLERIGGECAGALTFVTEGEPPPQPDSEYRELSNDQLTEILEILPKRPLLAGEKGVRLSLAGAQDKIAVRVDGEAKISLPLDYAGRKARKACCGTLRERTLAFQSTSIHQLFPVITLFYRERWQNVTPASPGPSAVCSEK